MIKNITVNILKGIIVGGSMLIPGVSGGTMAIILGIYDNLISSISSFFKNVKRNFIILFTFSFGAVLGMIFFSKYILYITQKYEMLMMYFFIGAVCGGVPIIYKRAKIKKFSAGSLIYILIGILIMLLISLIPEGLFSFNNKSIFTSYLILFFSGIISAVALVLPGISVSYMFLILGIYSDTIEAINEVYIPYLIPLAIGLFAGIILTAKILEYIMNNFSYVTYLIILGFIIASVAEVFPGIPVGNEIFISIFMFILGFSIIKKLSSIEI